MVDISFLGCSRGFGAEVAKAFSRAYPQASGLLAARNKARLETLGESLSMTTKTESMDFSKAAEIESRNWTMTLGRRVFYFAGGGPHGSFLGKNWRDHKWSFQVNFLTPAYLIHEFFQGGESPVGRQFIVVGSAIADESPDPGAVSYGAGKGALRRLVENFIAENPKLDLRLFRPGYMDTPLLPPQATPRLCGAPIADPRELAQHFVGWADDPAGPKIWTP